MSRVKEAFPTTPSKITPLPLTTCPRSPTLLYPSPECSRLPDTRHPRGLTVCLPVLEYRLRDARGLTPFCSLHSPPCTEQRLPHTLLVLVNTDRTNETDERHPVLSAVLKQSTLLVPPYLGTRSFLPGLAPRLTPAFPYPPHLLWNLPRPCALDPGLARVPALADSIAPEPNC